MAKKRGKRPVKRTKQQRMAAERKVAERAEYAEAVMKRNSMMKRAFTVAVCVVLVLALGIPTVALSVLSVS